MADQPWHELPPEIAGVFRPVLADVAGEMIDAVRTIPAYARPIDGEFGAGIQAGVQEALRHFLARSSCRRSAFPARSDGVPPRAVFNASTMPKTSRSLRCSRRR